VLSSPNRAGDPIAERKHPRDLFGPEMSRITQAARIHPLARGLLVCDTPRHG